MGVVRIFNAIMFSSCILVQWNDPDPVLWMFLYFVPLFWTIFPPAAQFARRWVQLNALVYLLTSLFLFPAEFHGLAAMNDQLPEIEEAREALGLMIASVGIFLTGWFVPTDPIQDELKK